MRRCVLALLVLAMLPATAAAQSSDVTVSVADMPDPVGPEQDVTFDVTVTNTGPDPAPTTQLYVLNEESLRFVSVTAPTGWTCAEPAVGDRASFPCSTAAMAVGSADFTVVLRATRQWSGTADRTLSTMFTTTTGPDPDPRNDRETEETLYLWPNADLVINADGSPEKVVPGETVTYEVAVGNVGPAGSGQTQVSAALPPPLRFASVVAVGWTCTTPAVGTSGIVTCTGPELAPGASSTLAFVASVDPAVGTDRMASAQFTVSGESDEPFPTSNQATIATAVDAPDADIGVSVTDSPDPVPSSSNVTYVANVSNLSGVTAGNVVLTDTLPAGLTFWSVTTSQGHCAGTSTVTCNLGDLAGGATATVTIVATVGGDVAQESTIANAFSVATGSGDPVAGNDTATAATLVRNPPDLHLYASSPPSAGVDSEAAFTIHVENEGKGTARDVEVTMTLPGGLVSLRQYAGPLASCVTPPLGQAGTATCTVPALAGGATLHLVLIVRTGAEGTITGNASVRSSTPDVDANDQSRELASPVQPREVGPQSTPCASRRHFALRLIRRDLPGLRVNLKGARVRSAVLRRQGSRRNLRKLRFTARRVRVDLRRLAPGRYVVRLRIRLRGGRTVTATARYRTCR